MFDPTDRARVFGLPPGADFPRELVAGLERRLEGRAPEDWTKVELFVNTRRMARRLTEVFAEGPARLLPRIRLVTDLANDPTAGALPPPAHPLARRLELARLTSALLAQEPDLAAKSAAFDLADTLATLMDEMQGEGVAPETIAQLDVSDQSGHWARAQRFFGIIAPFFAGGSEQDPEARQRRIVENLVAEWALSPPTHPVIVAGSTGSRGTTALFMRAVARLPQGAIVLPGYDFDMPDDIWPDLNDDPGGEDHPQFRFARLCRALDVAPDEVVRWTGADPDPARRALVSLALRPAPVTDGWLRDGPALGDLRDATARVGLLEAPNSRIEALAIALRLRQAVEDGRKAALITPDRTLARQVTAALDRWGIEPDDSAGRPLALSAPGRLLRHVAHGLGHHPTPETLLTILKHPLVHSGEGRGEHLRLTLELELWLRRDGPPHPNADTLRDWARRADIDGAAGWVDWLADTVLHLPAAVDGALPELVERHLSITTRLAGGSRSSGSGGLWEKTAGQAALTAMNDLAEQAGHGGPVGPGDYRALIDAVLSEEVRDPVLPHPDVMIWGTLEARVQGADLVILGGLNEGVWPEAPRPDPWLNRSMRARVGLRLPERRIGLSAHDFQQAICAPEVLITRSRRDDEAETVMSRWLNRLTNLMAGLPQTHGPEALEAMRQRGRVWTDRARALDARVIVAPRAVRPAPCPPASHRLTELSVTEIQRLIRDPYAVYARRILRLNALDPLRKDPDAAFRGSLFHAIFERYVRQDAAPGSPGAVDRFMDIAAQYLRSEVPWPATRTIWRAKLDAISGWFVQQDAQHRAAGATPVALERRGQFTVPGTSIQLRGEADRIDRCDDGSLIVLDYKTGTAPSARQIRQYDPQVLIEAVMAEAGAFDDVPPARVTRIGHVRLGSPMNWILHDLRDAKADVPLSPDEGLVMLRTLLNAYADPRKGFMARRAMERMGYGYGYDHLARFGEWDISQAAETVILR